MQDVVTPEGASMTGIGTWRDRLSLIAIGLVLCTASQSWGDQIDDDDNGTAPGAGQRPSIKQYDSRLPPVLPGEEVVTEQGGRMRVWSSAGPVPVNPQPTPQSLQGLGLGGVIIDGRVPPYGGDPRDGLSNSAPRR